MLAQSIALNDDRALSRKLGAVFSASESYHGCLYLWSWREI